LPCNATSLGQFRVHNSKTEYTLYNVFISLTLILFVSMSLRQIQAWPLPKMLFIWATRKHLYELNRADACMSRGGSDPLDHCHISNPCLLVWIPILAFYKVFSATRFYSNFSFPQQRLRTHAQSPQFNDLALCAFGVYPSNLSTGTLPLYGALACSQHPSKESHSSSSFACSSPRSCQTGRGRS
jgi:hypothetical protein